MFEYIEKITTIKTPVSCLPSARDSTFAHALSGRVAVDGAVSRQHSRGDIKQVDDVSVAVVSVERLRYPTAAWLDASQWLSG